MIYNNILAVSYNLYDKLYDKLENFHVRMVEW